MLLISDSATIGDRIQPVLILRCRFTRWHDITDYAADARSVNNITPGLGTS